MTNEEELNELRERVITLDSELYSLRSLAKRAIGDYDDLYKKYREAKKINDELQKKQSEQEIKFEQVMQVLQSAANDFAAMETKVQLGAFLQGEAERLASNLFRENRTIKRQSQRLITALGEHAIAIDIDIDGEPESEPVTDSVENQLLNDKITVLENKVQSLEGSLNNVKIENLSAVAKADEYWKLLEVERRKLKECKDSLSMYEAMKDNFERVSELASGRIETLEKELELERFLKEQAVVKASSLHREHQALRRQTMTMFNSPSEDESLQKALQQVQKLTIEFETQKQDYEKKLGELSSENQSETIDKLRAELTAVQKENETVSKQNEDLFRKLEKLNYDNRLMSDQLDQAKKGPPPPPPPPPPPIKILNPIKWITGKNKAPPKPDKPDNVKNFDKALEELMERIKNKPNQEPSVGMKKLLDDDTHHTSQQLNDFIGALKKTSFKQLPKPKEDEEPEFMKIRRKMSETSESLAKTVSPERKQLKKQSYSMSDSTDGGDDDEDSYVQLRRASAT